MNSREGVKQLQGFIDGAQLGQGLTHPLRIVSRLDKCETFPLQVREELITTLSFMLAAERFRLLILEDLSLINLSATLYARSLENLISHLLEYSSIAKYAAEEADAMARVFQEDYSQKEQSS